MKRAVLWRGHLSSCTNPPEENGGSWSAETDSRGRYQFEKVPPGVYTISANNRNWSEEKSGVKAGQENVDFVAGEPKGTGTLIGRVVDARTKIPIREFSVIGNMRGVTVETSSEEPGKFTAKGLQVGYSWKFTVRADGYRQEEGEVVIPSEGSTQEQTFELRTGGGGITGRVVDRSSKAPLAGVRVLLKGVGNSWDVNIRMPLETARTDVEGRFRFARVDAGSNFLQFKPDNPHVERSRSATVQHGQETDLGDVELGTGGTIRGRLVRMPGETPIPNGAIRLASGTDNTAVARDASTNEKGEFEFRALPAGSYSVGAPACKISQTLSVADEKVHEVVLRAGSGVLNGTVVRQGQPVPGARVVLRSGNNGPAFSTVSDAAGQFTVEGLAPGKWVVGLSARPTDQNLQAEDSIEIEGSETLQKTFRLTAVRLGGRVVNREGKGVSAARVIIRGQDASGKAFNALTQSKNDGAWTWDGVAAGNYTINATKKGYMPSPSLRMEVAEDGESMGAVLILRDEKDGGTLVSVTYGISDGKPLQKAWTRLKDTNGNYLEHTAERNAEGVMTIPAIPPGIYDVEVSAWGFSISNHPGTEIRAGETVRLEDVLHDCGSFDWTLTDKNGSPLRDVPVRFVPNDPGSMETVREGKTSAAGTYSTRGILPGRYTATATPSGKAPLTLPVTIVAHEGVEETTRVE